MLRHFICLANSFKYGGRCLAGVEISLSEDGKRYTVLHKDGNPQWISPVQQGTDHESIAIETAQNIRLLDVLELEVSDECGQGCQSENVYFTGLRIINHLSANDEHLQPLCTKEPYILYSERSYLTESEYQRGNHSLMLIKPERPNILIEKKEDDTGKIKTRYYAKFIYNAKEYKLPITDPEYLARMDSFSAIPLVGEFPTGTFYFAISIAAEPWNDVHHKLLAGIIDMRTIVSTMSTDGGFDSLPYRLAEEFSHTTNRCLFITGKAGTGKTTFLRKLREATPKNMAVVAPTGVAAINAGGMTIHSFFQLPIRTLVPTPESYRQLFAEQRIRQRKRNMLYHLEMLVIDEISMVRADVLDAIDAVLRHYKYRRDLPFGGVQVVMIGDLMQLSPVVHGDDGVALAKYYDGPYFFQSKVMQQLQPVYIELDHVFRQQNEQFVRLLNEVRDNRLSAESRAMLASRYQPDYTQKTSDKDFHITLTTHNQQADELNQRKLDELRGKLYQFKAEVFQNFPESSYPTDETLLLKEGARVMFIKNDDQKPRRFYNGKLGVVAKIGDGTIVVRCEEGEIEVEPVIWENIRYREDEQTGKITEEMLGTFRQFPLRLAWAITIHKSQGLTFDRVIIDAARAFAAGQVYVALSRCRTLEGIVLSSPLERVNLNNDRQVVDYVTQQPTTEQVEGQLSTAQREYRVQLFTDLYSMARPLTLIEQLQKHVVQCVSFNDDTLPFLDSLKKEINELRGVVDKFQTQLKRLILSDSTKLLQQRLNAAAGFFIPRIEAMTELIGAHPCRCKNKEDTSDFDTLIGDLYLVLCQKKALMQTIAKEGTTDAFLKAKSKYVAPPMATNSAFEKPTTKAKKPKEKKVKIPTQVHTYELFKAGNTPEQIAAQRGLALSTIFSHLTQYIEKGQLQVADLVPQEVIKRVQIAHSDHPDLTTLKEYYEALNEEVPYHYLRIALQEYFGN